MPVQKSVYSVFYSPKQCTILTMQHYLIVSFCCAYMYCVCVRARMCDRHGNLEVCATTHMLNSEDDIWNLFYAFTVKSNSGQALHGNTFIHIHSDILLAQALVFVGMIW